MQITGKLLEISNIVHVNETFKKREFVVEYSETQYPEYIKFEAIQDKCDLLNSFKPNEEVVVDFNLRGRKWTNPQGEVKYFNSLQAWRISKPKNDTPESDKEFDEMPPAGFDADLQEEIPF